MGRVFKFTGIDPVMSYRHRVELVNKIKAIALRDKRGAESLLVAMQKAVRETPERTINHDDQ